MKNRNYRILCLKTIFFYIWYSQNVVSMKVLIAGATGFIGKKLRSHLEKAGHNVVYLSRKKTSDEKCFLWNLEKNYIDAMAFEEVECIINLAGENIASKKWSENRKVEIYSSRVGSTNLLFEYAKQYCHSLKSFVSSSAVGFYGAINSDKIFDEECPAGSDFLANTCIDWEQAANRFQEIAKHVVILRLGVVLDKYGGALPKMLLPTKFFLNSALGSGHQYMPWIHLRDVLNMISFSICRKLKGTYNAVASEMVTNKEFTEAMYQSLGRKQILPNIPEPFVKFALGEMSVIMLKGLQISNEKIKRAGYNFIIDDLQEAFV